MLDTINTLIIKTYRTIRVPCLTIKRFARVIKETNPATINNYKSTRIKLYTTRPEIVLF